MPYIRFSRDMIIYSLCYTTVRPEYVEKVVNMWRERAILPEEIEIIISTDKDDPKFKGFRFPNGVRHVIQPDPKGDCVKGWNVAAAAAKGKVMIAVADDFIPPEHWDSKLSSFISQYPQGWDGEYVVKVSDGYNADLATLGIVTRKRYNRFGWLFYPQYESMFSDTELTHRAMQDGVILNANHLLFEHIHPDAGKRQRDASDMVHASPHRWALGETIFRYRQLRGFPTDVGPVFEASRAAAKSLSNYAVYLHTVKDDFCLPEVLTRMRDEGLRKFRIVTPRTYWSGAPTPESDIKQIEAIANTIKAPDVDIKMVLQDISSLASQARDRTHLETLARNQAFRLFREEGLHHILVVDSDELWRRGLTDTIGEMAASWHPTSIRTGMVPVAGVPGVAIGEAQDRVTVYQHSDTCFQNCRTPFGVPNELLGYDVIHFTATRRSMKDVVTKMRDSGHYGDPDYDFEGFIENKLPNVRLGSTDIHFYRGAQIWPYTRPWTKEEWADIPESIRPHLSQTLMPSTSKSTA